jgi:uncharacterized protein
MSDGGWSALTVDLRPLRAERGASLVVTVHETVASGVDEVPFHEPVEGTLTLTNLGGVVQVDGRVRTAVQMTCDRCAVPFAHRLEAEVDEELDWTSARAADAPGEEGGCLIDAGDTIALDVEALVREALLVALPMTARCQPDCPGLCERCGANLRIERCRCGQTVAETTAVDPRLAPLERWSERQKPGRLQGRVERE